MVLTTLIQRDYMWDYKSRTRESWLFKPLVKLNGNNANGIYFGADSWQQFLHNIGLMSELSGDNKLKPNPVTIKNIYISFTTAYGVRSILVTYKENEEKHGKYNLWKI